LTEKPFLTMTCSVFNRKILYFIQTIWYTNIYKYFTC